MCKIIRRLLRHRLYKLLQSSPQLTCHLRVQTRSPSVMCRSYASQISIQTTAPLDSVGMLEDRCCSGLVFLRRNQTTAVQELCEHIKAFVMCHTLPSYKSPAFLLLLTQKAVHALPKDSTLRIPCCTAAQLPMCLKLCASDIRHIAVTSSHPTRRGMRNCTAKRSAQCAAPPELTMHQ